MRRPDLARWAGAIVCLAVCSVPCAADEIQRNLLDAGINLGWAHAVLEYQGATPDNIEYLRGCMTRASDHLAAVQKLAGGALDFTGLRAEILAWESATLRAGRIAQAEYVASRHARLVQSVSAAGVPCRSAFISIGYHFGRANISSINGDGAMLAYRMGDLRTAISGGRQQANLKGCGFGSAGAWSAVSVLADTSPAAFDNGREQIQRIALDAAAEDPAGTPVAARWAGRWRSGADAAGDLEVRIQGNRLSADIYLTGKPQPDGKLEGEFIDARTVRGRWELWNPTRGGAFEWVMTDATGRTFDGWQTREQNYPAEIHGHKFRWFARRLR